MQYVPKLRFKEFKYNWHVGALEPHIDVLSGVPLTSDEISEDENGVPILRGINITEGFVRHSKDIDRYYLGNIKELEKFLVTEGDLVIGMDGSKVGKNVAIISEKDSGSILIQRVARIRNKTTSDIRFIYHHIFSSKFHRYVDEVNTSSGIPHISMRQICEFEIGLPLLPEQQKIASFLSAVDEKIQHLTRKKELLEQYKNGVMQQLFSGKLRFKDENGKPYPKWEKKGLGDEIEVISGFAFKGTDISEMEGGIPLMRGINITEGLVRHDKDIDRFFHGDASNLKHLELLVDDLVIGMDGSKVGKNAALITKRDQGALLVQRVARIRCKKSSSIHFVYHQIRSDSFIKYVDTVNTSSGIPHISLNQIRDFKVSFPVKEEQQKIAKALSGLDSKIEGVSNQITQIQTFKKGLLQQMFV
jgi:type I restriction enzyme, S subunit